MQLAIFAGLGNQLFQYSAAHLIQESGHNEMVLVIDRSPQMDRPFLLEHLFLNCNHQISSRVSEIRETKGRNRFLKLFAKTFPRPLSNLFKRLPIAYEGNPYQYDLKQFQKEKLNVGYFQHWKYVESAWPIMGYEVVKHLDKVDLPQDLLRELDGSIVIHIRRGDLTSSRETMGLLSLEYYERAIGKLRSKSSSNNIIALTDDLVGSADLAQQLKVKRLIGPEELNQWEALAFMAKSKRLVVANSTFSWWAGYLALKESAIVAIPDPWFKNWHQDIDDAFQHPLMQLVESSFL